MADEKAKAKPEPEKTGQQLLAHLRQTGTGAGRQEALERFLRQHKDATGVEALEFMRGEMVTFPAGTIQKAGQFIHGDGYQFRDPNTAPQTRDEELDSLRQEVAELRRQLRATDAKNHAQLQELARLRKVADVRMAQEPDLRSKSFDETEKPQTGKRELAGAGAR